MFSRAKNLERKLFFSFYEKEAKLNHLPLSEINITPPELYIRQAINHKWVTKLREILKEGKELDPILVTRRVEGIDRENIIVSGNHRYLAYQRTISILRFPFSLQAFTFHLYYYGFGATFWTYFI